MGERRDPEEPRFERLDRIGAGGMGTVWKARDRLTGELVAVKRLHENLAEDEGVVQRFEHEVLLSQRANSEHSVRVAGFGFEDDRPYMVMEYIEGSSLRKLLADEKQLPWDRAKAITRDVVSALQIAHANGVIHRDVKPSNILIGPDGGAKLADFGIAKANDLTSLTGSQTMLGTLPYMAPEPEPGASGDLYSLGVVLYEMLTGAVPFPGDPIEARLQHRTAEPDLGRITDSGARNLVAWLLQKDPRRRPADAAALLAVLSGSTPSPAFGNTGATRRGGGWIRRPAFAVPAVISFGALSLGLGGAAIFALGGGDDDPVVNPPHTATATRTATASPTAVPTGGGGISTATPTRVPSGTTATATTAGGGGGGSTPTPTPTNRPPTSTPVPPTATFTPTTPPPPPTATFTPQAQKPNAPGNTAYCGGTTTSFCFTWVDQSSNEDGFRIYMNNEFHTVVGPNVTSYTASGLIPGQTYCFKVAAFNAGGESARVNSPCKNP